MAVTEPIAVRLPCHFSAFTVATDTDSGGWAKLLPISASLRIWRALTPTKPAAINRTIATAITILRIIKFLPATAGQLSLVVPRRSGARSGILSATSIPRGAFEKQPHDLPGSLPIQRAFGHQQTHHHMAVKLPINSHRQLLHAEPAVQFPTGLPSFDQ